MGDHVTIFIKLLDEAVDVWRPVEAEDVGGGQYRVAGRIPEGEEWQFQTGDVVRCHHRDFADGTSGLVAFSRRQ